MVSMDTTAYRPLSTVDPFSHEFLREAGPAVREAGTLPLRIVAA
jgi:hypothetical protein